MISHQRTPNPNTFGAYKTANISLRTAIPHTTVYDVKIDRLTQRPDSNLVDRSPSKPFAKELLQLS